MRASRQEIARGKVRFVGLIATIGLVLGGLAAGVEYAGDNKELQLFYGSLGTFVGGLVGLVGTTVAANIVASRTR